MVRRLGLVALAALIIGLVGGGGAYAGSKITGAQIKDGTITTRDVKDKSLMGRDIADVSISEDKLTNSALKTLSGAPGPAGPVGPAGTSSVTRVSGVKVAQGAFGSGTEVQAASATCPAGTYVSGGGYDARTIENVVGFAMSTSTQYLVIAVNEYSQPGSITVQAICVGGSSVVASSVRSTRPPAKVREMVKRLQADLNRRR